MGDDETDETFQELAEAMETERLKAPRSDRERILAAAIESLDDAAVTLVELQCLEDAGTERRAFFNNLSARATDLEERLLAEWRAECERTG